jgi:predicted nucleic acid-binding protein
VYLVDTNIISVTAPTKPQPGSALAAWMERNTDRLYMSAVTVMEIEDGIAKAERMGALQKAALLEAWFETLMHLYSDRIIAFDLELHGSPAAFRTSRAAVAFPPALQISRLPPPPGGTGWWC